MKALVTVLAVLICSIQTAYSFDGLESYPGKSRGGKTVYYGVVYVQAALSAYYKGHGSWPASWEDVLRSGIVQVDLIGPRGEAINPGDGSLDFAFDVVYDPQATGRNSEGRAVLRTQKARTAPYEILVRPQETYRQYYAEKPEMAGFLDEACLQQMMIAAMIDHALLTFNMVYERWPNSREEFFGSGLSPVDEGATVPESGSSINLTKSPGDIELYLSKKDGKVVGAMARPIDDQGNVFPSILMPY